MGESNEDGITTGRWKASDNENKSLIIIIRHYPNNDIRYSFMNDDLLFTYNVRL